MPGAQTAALNSKADILLYGGAAGGGKSDLILGAARQHHRSIIFRRTYSNLENLIDRSKEIFTGGSYIGSPHPRWKFDEGSQAAFAAMQYEDDKLNYRGRAHDFYGMDEITEFTETQFRFIIGWNRSVRRGQRCRVICTCNPPSNSGGEWIIDYWAPWLDKTHIKPAMPGELRFFTSLDGVDTEVDSGEPFMHKGERVIPKSRTFIPARLDDNPYYGEEYRATLQAMPEPHRSMMLYGDFSAGREDDAYQVIPSDWLEAAQARWRTIQTPSAPLTCIGVDVARGGNDKTVLTPRFGNYFGKQAVYPGAHTPDGDSVAKLALEMRNGLSCKINIDVIGVGASAFDILRRLLGSKSVAMHASEGSEALDKSGELGFINKRSEWWWKLREALDPASGQELAIPDDRELFADLCAPTYKLTARGYQVESKEEIKKRIGRSPDKGDSLVYSASISHSSADSWNEAYERMTEENKQEIERRIKEHR